MGRKKIHGLSDHELYSKWQQMVYRCNNTKHEMYRYYGGSNIKVCNEWLKSPKLYIDHIMSLEGYGMCGYSIDRVDNDRGYKPGNLRWTDRHTQTANRRKQKRNKTGFIGVEFHKKKFRFTIIKNGEKIRRYGFATPEEAAKARDQFIIENGLYEYPLQTI